MKASTKNCQFYDPTSRCFIQTVGPDLIYVVHACKTFSKSIDALKGPSIHLGKKFFGALKHIIHLKMNVISCLNLFLTYVAGHFGLLLFFFFNFMIRIQVIY
jgi:hypothetical protein